MKKLWSGFSREFKLLFLTWLFVGITTGIYDTVFSNYLSDVFQITAQVRGYLELPREFPGFFIAIISGLLIFLADVRLLGVSVALVSVGMLGQSFYSWGGEPQFSWMVFSMIIWSIGTHLFMPLSSSVTLQLSAEKDVGKNLGLLNGAQTAASLIGCVVIWIVMGFFKLEYSWVFQLAAFFGLIATICAFMMKVGHQPKEKDVKFKLLFRKEYSLFYWLSVLYGARKQVFMTFAPWVIVKVYHQPATIMAVLMFISAVIGVFFKPWLGKAIDHFGEKAIIAAEAVLFILVCLGYSFGGKIGLGQFAIYLVFSCYIVDLLLSSVAMARTTYLHKNLVEKDDLTPTLSMGISLDHAVAMSVPILGGLLWDRFGYESIFLGAALISAANIWIAGKIKEQSVPIELNQAG